MLQSINFTSIVANTALIQNRLKNWMKHLAKYDFEPIQMKQSMVYNYKDPKKRLRSGDAPLRNLPFVGITFGAAVGLVVTLVGEAANRGGLRDATDRELCKRWLQRLFTNQMVGWTEIRINCDKQAERFGRHNIGANPVFFRS